MSVSHRLITTCTYLALQLAYIVICNVLGVSQEKYQTLLDAGQLTGWITHGLMVSIISWYIHGPLISSPIYQLSLALLLSFHSDVWGVFSPFSFLWDLFSWAVVLISSYPLMLPFSCLLIFLPCPPSPPAHNSLDHPRTPHPRFPRHRLGWLWLSTSKYLL